MGCTSTTVLLNSRYLSEQQIVEVSNAMEAQGYQVETNQHYFPDDINHSSLVYSPLIQDPLAVDRITLILEQAGWPLQSTRPLLSGKHWYTKDTVGVYLLPEGVKPHNRQAERDLTNLYQARHCDTEAQMQFEENGQLTLRLPNTMERDIRGSWQIKSYPIVEIHLNGRDWPLYFSLERLIETDQVSEIEILELVPLDSYEGFRDCRFAFGLRRF